MTFEVIEAPQFFQHIASLFFNVVAIRIVKVKAAAHLNVVRIPRTYVEVMLDFTFIPEIVKYLYFQLMISLNTYCTYTCEILCFLCTRSEV
jgi:hypothetical protein